MHSEFNGYAPKQTSRMYSLMPLHKWKNLSKFVPGISLLLHINIQHTTSALVRLYSCKTLKPPVQLYWLPWHRSAVVSTQPYSTIFYTDRVNLLLIDGSKYQSTNMSISHLPILSIFLSKNLWIILIQICLLSYFKTFQHWLMHPICLIYKLWQSIININQFHLSITTAYQPS